MKKILIFLPLLVIVISGGMMGCKNKNRNEFVDYAVYVTLTSEASLNAYQTDKVYSPIDFPEIELTEVRSLFIQPDWLTLVLYLQTPGKQNVLNAITLLSGRSDVKSASQMSYES